MAATLVCRSNLSFLTGASHPEELVRTAGQLGISALALTDDDGLYGAVKAHLAAQQAGMHYIVAARMTIEGQGSVCLYAQNLAGYQNLCRLISQGRLSSAKGSSTLRWHEVAERAEGLCALLPDPDEPSKVAPLAEAFPGRFYVGLLRTLSVADLDHNLRAEQLARELRLPLCAHTDVHLHERGRKPLLDVLTAIRLGTTVARAGQMLFPNAERVLKGPEALGALFGDRPLALENSMALAASCSFRLDELTYRFSEEAVPQGHTPHSFLRVLVQEGLSVRYPSGVPAQVHRQIDRELALIEQRNFAGYFLSLWEIVRFARQRGILCQGRGSAANSAVCYALQLTAIDPVRMGLLFERFLSMERKEPPDIDVDFEHARREEVLQYVYQKHGRSRAAMVCEVITYRGKLALREVGKALGLSRDQLDRLCAGVEGAGEDALGLELLSEAGLSAGEPLARKVIELALELRGTPRHLSIHVGGFVITQDELSALVPLENATMKDRTVVQWEKDDLSALEILKVDLLALGMLTALSYCFKALAEHHGLELSMATTPAEDPCVYDMICDADTIGTFQIESRAQMNMLPRLRPRTFYDLVIEIAIIRPGPIVGDMVHPYLRRRDGLEKVDYPSPQVRAILERTLGVPLFQEQAMRLAMVAAGFSAGEADGLRRALAHKRAKELLPPIRERFVRGCVQRGYPQEFAERCFEQFNGFAHYGFPESHSASFALIAYASCYLKLYYTAAFCMAVLNAQPMGFYAAHTLVEDARRHGVEVRPVDVERSGWDCTLEGREPGSAARGFGTPRAAGGMAHKARLGEQGPALRLGLRLIKGLQEKTARRIEASRGEGYGSLSELVRRARVPRHELARLALAGALGSLCAAGRRQALWEIEALGPMDEGDLFFAMELDRTSVELPSMSAAERVSADFATVGLSLEQHPLALLRPGLRRLGALDAEGLSRARSGQRACVGGMAIVAQRPGTARGFTFISLEDETGISNLVLEPALYERYRKEIVGALFLLAHGTVERSGKVVNLKVQKLRRLVLEGREAG